MSWLVDAHVLSEPTRAHPDSGVVDWLRSHERGLRVDPIILGEVRFGILLLPPGKRRARLERWFEGAVARIECLPWDSSTGLRWAALLAQLRAEGRAMPIKDSQIAATARTHGLTVVTRNVRDFASAGVAVLNPFGN